MGDQDSRGHRRARAKYLKTENVWGVEETAANKGSLRLQHFIFYLDIAIVCCWAVCGLSTCAIYRQGSTWTNTAPTRFNVGLLVEAGDGGGGALVPGSGSWTLFLFFFGAVGEGNIEVKVQEAGTVLLILGTMLGGGTFCSDTRRTPFPLLVAAGLQWKGEKGQATAMKAV